MIKHYLSSIVVAAALFICGGAVAGGKSLDGRTFAVSFKDPATKKMQTDTLIFKKGTFDSKGCRPYGFKPVAYKVTKKGRGFGFVAKARSAKEGVMRWTGTVTGKMVRGKAVWTKKGQKKIVYMFKGKIAAK